MAKNKDLLQEGPGDLKEKPQVQEYRGDDGNSASMIHKKEETKAVAGYDR